jgi:hypothetical protein
MLAFGFLLNPFSGVSGDEAELLSNDIRRNRIERAQFANGTTLPDGHVY